MTDKEKLEYALLAVKSMSESRVHFADSADARRKHIREYQEVVKWLQEINVLSN